jgi:conjugal transfer/type IV secretion protein DotA/TraY
VDASQPQEINQPAKPTAGRLLKFAGRAAKYAILPGLFPRLRGLSYAVSRFLFNFTQIFGIAGLIEPNHPCLRPQNIGHYRFTDIIRLALYGVLQDRRNPQKWFIFIATLGALIMTVTLVFIAFAMLVLSVPTAYAQYFGDLPASQGYVVAEDFAYKFLNEVFGNIGVSFFGPGGHTDHNVLFSPMLRGMFTVYSQGILILAVLIIIYLIGKMAIESARTGVPFGKSFNSVWAPFRIALGIGLLVPVGQGYNGAQLLAFQMSNWGSALATNIWAQGLSAFDTLVAGPTFTGDVLNQPGFKLIQASQPIPPYNFMRGLFITYLCRDAMNLNLFASCSGDFSMDVDNEEEGKYTKYWVGTYKGVFALNSDYCGEYKVPLATEFPPVGIRISPNDDPVLIGQFGQLIANKYVEFYDKALEMITAATSRIAVEIHENQQMKIQDMAEDEVKRLHVRLIKLYNIKMGYKNGLYFNTSAGDAPMYGGNDPDMSADVFGDTTPPPYVDMALADGQALLQVMTAGKKYGWASAGSVIMMLSHVNNIVSSAVNTPPVATAAPRLLTMPAASPYYRNEALSETGFFEGLFSYLGIARSDIDVLKDTGDTISQGNTWFGDRMGDGWPEDINGLPPPAGMANDSMARELGVKMTVWNAQTRDRNAENSQDVDLLASGNAEAILWSMVNVSDQDMNPLTQIIAIGSGLFTMAVGMLAVGAIAALFTLTPAIFGVAFSLSVPLIIASYVLTVVLPFVLFANFMFAVVEWVMSVFEAILAMPLWALSLITIEGEGLGKMGGEGLKRLVEIMLRPSVIIVVTVGTIVMFAAAAHFFNKAFTLFMSNYFAATSDGAIGTIKNVLVVFGSVFLYVLTIYSIGNSCFKMIPTIANDFMRWIGGKGGFSGVMETDFDQISGLKNIEQVTGMGKGLMGGRDD